MRQPLIYITIFAALLSACSGETSVRKIQPTPLPSDPVAATPAVIASSAPMVAIAASNIAAATSEPNAPITHTLPSHRPMIISADLRFRTTDVRKTAVAIEQLSTQYGGFVVSNQTQTNIINHYQTEQSDGTLLQLDYYISQTHLTVRIPNQNSQSFLHALQPHIQLLEKQHFSATDISSAMQRQLLATQREQHHAPTPSPQQVHLQEDEAKIQQAELQNQIQYATIELHFRQPEQFVKNTLITPHTAAAQYRPSFWQSAQQAFASSWLAISYILLFLMKIWYICLMIMLLAYWFYRYKKSVRPQPKTTVEIHYPEFEIQEWIDEPTKHHHHQK